MRFPVTTADFFWWGIIQVGHRLKLTEIIEGAASGWRDLEEAWIDEGSEGGRRFVFLHVVTGLALK